MDKNFKKAKTVEARRSELNESKFTEYRESSIMDRIVYRFKVILLGDIAVGKSSILSRFVEEKYTNEYRCNVGVEFKVKSLYLDETKGADLQIWDTCGEERFRTITRQYYRDSNGNYKLIYKFTIGVILIFDLTNRSSFEGLDKWIEDIFNFGPKDVNIVLVGNKSDLDDERTTSFNEATTLSSKYNVPYVEVSAKTGNNVALVFENLTKVMVKREEENDKKKKKKGKIDKSHVTANKSIMLDNTISKERKESKCC